MSSPQTTPMARATALRWTAGAGLFGAALVHAMAVPVHYEHWRAAGFFFALLAVAEANLAALLAVSTRRSVAGAAVALNAGTMALWAVSRTVGLPFGPEAGHAEITGTADLMATGFEAVSGLAAGLLLARSSLRVVSPRLVNHLVGASLTSVLLVGTGVVAAPSLADHGHAPDAADHPHAAATPGRGPGDDDAVHDDGATHVAPSLSAGVVSPGGTTAGYVDIHGHKVAGNPADGAALGHPPAGEGATTCDPVQAGGHVESEAVMEAAALRFDRDELRLAEGLNVVTFRNQDAAPHNITVWDAAKPGCTLFEGRLVLAGGSSEYSITMPHTGEYRFRCDLHPQMAGTVVVVGHD